MFSFFCILQKILTFLEMGFVIVSKDFNTHTQDTHNDTMTPTFGTVFFTLLTHLRLISIRMDDDDLLVVFGTNQSASHFHSQIVIYRKRESVQQEILKCL